MLKSKLLLLYLVAFYFASINTLLGQELDINIKDTYFSKNLLTIVYDIENASVRSAYYINLEVKDKKGNILPTTILHGDLGGISNSSGNSIQCNFAENNIYINDEVTVKLVGDYMYFKTTIPQTIFFSSLVPGLGKFKIQQEKRYFINAALAYTSLAGGLYMGYRYDKAYQKYQQETAIGKRNDLHLKATRNFYLSNSLFLISATVWLTDITGAVIKLNRLKKRVF